MQINKYKSVIWYFAFAILFLAIGVLNLNTYPIEGDEARVFSYHLSNGILPPYSSIQQGFDLLISFYKSNNNLYGIILGISFFSQLFSIVILSEISKQILKSKLNAGFLAFISIIAFPELIWQGLYCNPSAIALLFSSMGIYVFLKTQNCNFATLNRIYLILSAICIGLSMYFRWTHALIFIPFWALILLYDIKMIYKLMIASILSLVILLLSLYLINGITFYDFINNIGVLKSLSSAFSGTQIKTTLLANIPMFSPILIFIFFTKKIRNTIYYILILSIGFAIISPAFIPKYYNFLNIVYFIMLCVILNLEFKIQKIYHVALAFIILIPWVLGISITFKNSSWGKGFEYNFITNKANYTILKSEISIEGLAIPSPEGIRSIGGYYNSLLTGKWKKLHQDMYKSNIIMLNDTMSKLIIIIDDHAYIDYYLLEKRYLPKSIEIKKLNVLFYQKNKHHIYIYKCNNAQLKNEDIEILKTKFFNIPIYINVLNNSSLDQIQKHKQNLKLDYCNQNYFKLN